MLSEFLLLFSPPYMRIHSHSIHPYRPSNANASHRIGAKKSWTGQYTVDCSTIPSLPPLGFVFNDETYTLSAEDYILNVQGTCVSGFQGLDINVPGGSLWIIGEYICVMGVEII